MTVLKKIIVIIMCLFTILGIQAQNISVASFKMLPNDLTANTNGTEVLDQNGDKAALIKVVTTQTGFTFEGGALGICSTKQKNGEIWVYIPQKSKKITLLHQSLGVLRDYYFPCAIEAAGVYEMRLRTITEQRYDDTKRQKLLIHVQPSNATFSLNGMNVSLDVNGFHNQILSKGTYTYKVEAHGYKSKEGQIVMDGENPQTLTIDNLEPIYGKINIRTEPYNAEVFVDGNLVDMSKSDIQVGEHEVIVKCKGYKSDCKNITIVEGKTTELTFSLVKNNIFNINSNPSGASIFINDTYLSITPCTAELSSGTYSVEAKCPGYKSYKKKMQFDAANPNIDINLYKDFNKNKELYIEGCAKFGTFTAVGINIGGYMSNFNAELAYLFGLDKSEKIIWTNSYNNQKMTCTYTPSTNVCGKIGYSINVSTRYRITPLIGINYISLEEKVESNESLISPADGAYTTSVVGALRMSVIITEHFGISIIPEYDVAINKSKGYKCLSEISPQVNKWMDGFNVKLGLFAIL